MVVAIADFQRLVVGANIASQRLFLVEVHGSALHRQQFAGGHAGGVGLQKALGVHRQAVSQRGAAGVAVQVEIAVVGQVADGGRVGGGAVLDDQSAPRQAVLNLKIHVAGEAVHAVRAAGGEGHAVIGAGGDLHGKYRVVQPVQAAVQAVAALVGGDMDDVLVQRELRAADAVGVAPHDGAHGVPAVHLIVRHGGVAQRHIHQTTLAVRHHKAVHHTGVAQNLSGDLFIFQRCAMDDRPVGGTAEFGDGNRHEGPPYSFSCFSCSRS